MNEKKRALTFLAVAAALLLLFTLLVCLVNSRASVQTVGICFRNTQENEEHCALLRQTLANAGYAVIVADANNDPAAQSQQLASFVEQEVDALVIEPAGDAQQLALQAKQANIPAVFIGYEAPNAALDSWEKLAYVGCQAQQHGILQGSILMNNADKGDINGDGVISYLIITGPEGDLRAEQQAEGCVSALAQTGLTGSAIGVEWGAWSKDRSREVCAQALSHYGKDIEVIFCADDTLAAGALEAIENGGWQAGTDYYLLGIGGTSQAVGAVRDGLMTGTVSENWTGKAEKVLELIRKFCNEEAVEKLNYVNCTTVHRENVQQYLPK